MDRAIFASGEDAVGAVGGARDEERARIAHFASVSASQPIGPVPTLTNGTSSTLVGCMTCHFSENPQGWRKLFWVGGNGLGS